MYTKFCHRSPYCLSAGVRVGAVPDLCSGLQRSSGARGLWLDDQSMVPTMVPTCIRSLEPLRSKQGSWGLLLQEESSTGMCFVGFCHETCPTLPAANRRQPASSLASKCPVRAGCIVYPPSVRTRENQLKCQTTSPTQICNRAPGSRHSRHSLTERGKACGMPP